MTWSNVIHYVVTDADLRSQTTQKQYPINIYHYLFFLFVRRFVATKIFKKSTIIEMNHWTLDAVTSFFSCVSVSVLMVIGTLSNHSGTKRRQIFVETTNKYYDWTIALTFEKSTAFDFEEVSNEGSAECFEFNQSTLCNILDLFSDDKS